MSQFNAPSMGAIETLEKTKTVDGNGSGLDADLVRGLPADFTCSLGQNGYQQYPSGKIKQWGYAAAVGGITFPIAFPSACHNVQATVNSSSGGAASDNQIRVYGASTTGFSYLSVNSNFPVYWEATGE